MIQLIRDILTSDAGSFPFVFALMILAFWLVHWVTKKVTTINSEHSELTKTTTKIDTHIDEVRKDLSFLKGVINNNDVDEMRKDLSYLKGSFDIIRSGANPLTKSKSPISLTEKGLEVAEKINARDIIANNWEKIYADLESNICDKNAYDIQEYCIETASVEPERFFDKDTLSKLKDFAYNEGRPLQYYGGMLGVLIRDKYLNIKGIDVSEVDATLSN